MTGLAEFIWFCMQIGKGDLMSVVGWSQQLLLMHCAMVEQKPCLFFGMTDLQDAPLHPAESNHRRIRRSTDALYHDPDRLFTASVVDALSHNKHWHAASSAFSVAFGAVSRAASSAASGAASFAASSV